MLNGVDKDVPIFPEITKACINTHLLSASKLTEMQLFELMNFVISNQSVVDLINQGKVHEQIKSLVALQKYLVKQYVASANNMTPRTFSLACQRLTKLVDISQRPLCKPLLGNVAETAAKYRDKDLEKVWSAFNNTFIQLKPKLSARDFCDVVTLFCVAGILEDEFFYRESLRRIQADPSSLKVLDIITLLRIMTTFDPFSSF